jgi:hypothetical protein
MFRKLLCGVKTSNNILCPKEKVIDAQGYNGTVPDSCQHSSLEGEFDYLDINHKRCGGIYLCESIIAEPHPWILCVSSHEEMPPV